jgi:hypothetical protein
MCKPCENIPLNVRHQRHTANLNDLPELGSGLAQKSSGYKKKINKKNVM